MRKAGRFLFIHCLSLCFLALSACQSGPVPGTDGFGSDDPTDAAGPGLFTGKAGGLIIHQDPSEKEDQ